MDVTQENVLALEKVPMTDEAFDMRTRAPAISFNYAGLEEQAKALMSKYEGLIVSEDQVKGIKKEMAEINALKIRLDNARKEAKRQIEAPVKEFEAQVKKICAIFDRTYAALGAQVKAFTEKEREEKRGKVQPIIDEELQAASARVAPFPIPIQESWLNKSTTLKAVREAVRDIIEQRIQSEAARKQAEQARTERASAIEQAVKAANAEYGTALTVAQFMSQGNLNLETPLTDVTMGIMQAAQAAANAQAARQAPAATPSAQTAQAAPETSLSIILRFSAENEGAVRFALNKLKNLCTEFAVRKQ
ncbi:MULTISPECIES: DUF1351 domain-containing protein [unclassified Desulfovibrio]|uniref:DUF1351 domain-containing protein n=1 Tax=unclassified Desulfovibrio TaxID=2593640 RepID=UPI0013EE3DEB|nr:MULTISPECIES: DUF1351 domain-containing protein [unclassified Desulfovibrio]